MHYYDDKNNAKYIFIPVIMFNMVHSVFNLASPKRLIVQSGVTELVPDRKYYVRVGSLIPQ